MFLLRRYSLGFSSPVSGHSSMLMGLSGEKEVEKDVRGRAGERDCVELEESFKGRRKVMIRMKTKESLY